MGVDEPEEVGGDGAQSMEGLVRPGAAERLHAAGVGWGREVGFKVRCVSAERLM